MQSFLPTLLALASATTTSAVTLPATHGQPQAPNLPEGFFAGYNNPDGTSTLHFPDTNENVTFTPVSDPESSLEKRQDPDEIQFVCGPGTLDRAGLDSGMNQMRERLSHTPIGVGQWHDWPPYFGYNANGVYTYICEATGATGAHLDFGMDAFNEYSYHLDRRCGAYVAGYIHDKPWYLFGRAKSGTKVCQGNWRSPR